LKREFNQVEDFLDDHSFREWVLNEANQRNLFWETWTRKNPEKSAVFLEAKEILLALGNQVSEWDDEDQERLLSSIDQKIDAKEQGGVPIGREPSQYRRWMNWAAILLVLMSGATLAIWTLEPLPEKGEGPLAAVEDQWISNVSGPGEKKRIRLPDGSEVILNSSSEIRYNAGFGKSNRDVFLAGESFFQVAKDSLTPFRVMSGELTTEALGTSFIVKRYEDEEKTQVMLVSGKVKVENENGPGKGNDLLFLSAGEEALLTSVDFKKSQFNAETALLWTKGILYFNDTPFSEAIPILEKWYGVEITISGKGVEELKISGEFINDSLENVLKSICYSFQCKFQISERSVFIQV